MVTNNKVLTVSYGTFSCTLEGFDDSFDTMKAIAEYFRDLAADDRYFGAEPPTPDAEMLARIAEREIERRVQARTEHGAIVLSTGDMASDLDEPPAEAAQDVAEEEIAEATEDDVVEVVAEEDVSEEPEAEPEIVDVTDSVLLAVAADEADSEDPAQEDVLDADASDEIEGEAEEAAEAIAEDESIQPAEASEPEAEEDEETAVAADAEDTSDADETEIVALEETDEVEDAQVDVADVIEDAELVEVSDEESDDDSEESMISDILEITEEDTADVEEAEAQDALEETPVAEVIEPEPEAKKDPNADSIAAKLQRIRAVVSKSRNEPEAEDYSEDEHAEPLVVDAPKEAEQVLTLDGDMAAAAAAMDAEVSEDEARDEPAEITEVQPVRARVIRMKKADFEAAVDTGLLEAEAVDEDEDDADEARSSSLSAEEEAELLAELAQVEAELNGEVEDDEPVEAIGADPEDSLHRSERGRHLSDTSGQTDADMTRLMQETDTQMDEPDGSRRRQAIAHLRAAVAATKAEQKAGKDGDKPKDVTEAYRDDLASVMRPATTDAPKPSAQPPLTLVAEQRVDADDEAQIEDMPEETPRAPVRPRRVSAADRNERPEAAPVGHDAGSFAEFAETAGANDLPKILEAAAAYLTFVEKLDVFSRPMIVRMAQGMGEGDYSREDSLRGFGQLLRENKITKVSGGQFTASDDISFRPEDRAAG